MALGAVWSQSVKQAAFALRLVRGKVFQFPTCLFNENCLSIALSLSLQSLPPLSYSYSQPPPPPLSLFLSHLSPLSPLHISLSHLYIYLILFPLLFPFYFSLPLFSSRSDAVSSVEL